MQLSDNDKQAWCAEQELLDRVMAVVGCPGPCDRVTVDAALLDRPAPTDVPNDPTVAPSSVPTDVPARGTGRSARHPGVLVIPYPREGSQA